MKCTVCKQKAVIELDQHNLKLCSEHFISRFDKKFLSTVREYKMFNKDQKCAVAVSGGKDSLALLYLMNKHNFKFKAFYIDLEIKKCGYSAGSLVKIKEFSKKHGIPFETVKLKKEIGFNVDEAVEKLKTKECSVCGKIKRYIFNRFALKNDCGVILTGHNLDDETSALFSNLIRWKYEYLAKQNPVLKSSGNLKTKAKPLCFFTERETAAYCILNKIDYFKMDCPYSTDAKSILYKKLLNQVEIKSPSTKTAFFKEYLRRGINFFKKREEETSAVKCAECGMPSYSGLCAVCKMKKIVNKKGI